MAPSDWPSTEFTWGCTPSNSILQVCDIVTEFGTWDWEHLRRLVPMHIIRHIIALTPPSAEIAADHLAWKWATKADCSAIETYKHLFSADVGNAGPWKIIWKACVPQRVRVFF